MKTENVNSKSIFFLKRVCKPRDGVPIDLPIQVNTQGGGF